jgi:hypothetical protein
MGSKRANKTLYYWRGATPLQPFLKPPRGPIMTKVSPPKYIRIVCKDTVWVIALLTMLSRKFGYGQAVQRYDAFLDYLPNGDVQFHLNRETIPMDKVARLIGTTEEALAGMGDVTLKEVPFDPALPKPNSVWGAA